MRNRLRLAVGSAAVIDEELAADGPRHRFAARGPGDPPDGPATRVVVVLPPPPVGPPSGAVLDRLAAIRVIAAPALAAPLATGGFDDGTWVVEALPTGLTLAEQLARNGPLAVQQVVRLLRDTARALGTLHRHALSHGALSPAVVEASPHGVVLHGLASRLDGSVADDLHALGELAWTALIGRPPEVGDPALTDLRRRVPPELDRLVRALLDPDPTRRPGSAHAVLETLDRFPDGQPTSLEGLVDGTGRGARAPGERRTALLLGVIGVLVILGWLFLRAR